MRSASRTTVILCLLAVRLLAADNPFLGTWKVDVAKSQFSPGPGPKELTVRLEQDGDKVHRIATGTNADGSAIHEESSILWDGKDHLAAKPSESSRTVAVTQVDSRTLQLIVKQDGKVTHRIHLIISPDGKTTRQTDDGVNEKGEKVHNVLFG